MKRQDTDWEKIFVKHTYNTGQISKIYKEFLKLNQEKINDLTKIWVKYLNRLTKKDIQMANRHMIKCSKSDVSRELQMRTKNHIHLLFGMAKIQNTKCW